MVDKWYSFTHSFSSESFFFFFSLYRLSLKSIILLTELQTDRLAFSFISMHLKSLSGWVLKVAGNCGGWCIAVGWFCRGVLWHRYNLKGARKSNSSPLQMFTQTESIDPALLKTPSSSLQHKKRLVEVLTRLKTFLK